MTRSAADITAELSHVNRKIDELESQLAGLKDERLWLERERRVALIVEQAAADAAVHA